jgi:DNA-binding MarR family transcriptional regulator/GNAT superfamily N-acetyltransferase
MDATSSFTDAVTRVRRFNRTVTQRVGALDDRFLSLNRPLGQARVLWEIGPDGVDVRTLRARLGLDSGYLSRLLRALEGDGLVRVETSAADARVRTARLTGDGVAERAELDRRSDAMATDLLDALPPADRDRLVTAMGEVERLLVASRVRFGVVDPDHPHARFCLTSYYAELVDRFEEGFDPALSVSTAGADLRPPRGLFLVATLDDEAVACGALLFHPGEPAYIKRMWVSPTVRGLGLGRRLLRELESTAREQSSATVRLETNRALPEAIAMYRSSGYREVDRFNDEIYGHHFFEKDL